MPRDLVLAIDVGGTKLAAGVVREDGSLLSADKAPSLPCDDPEGLYQTLLGLCRRALEQANMQVSDLRAIGVGAVGPMEYPAGILGTLNLPAWRHGFPLRVNSNENVTERAF